MAVTFHSVPGQSTALACDECGAMVSKEDRDRVLHDRWHRDRDELIVDLTRENVVIELDKRREMHRSA